MESFNKYLEAYISIGLSFDGTIHEWSPHGRARC